MQRDNTKEFCRERWLHKLCLRANHITRNMIWQAVLLPNFIHERKRLKRFKGLHHHKKRCFLVGNGPSIKNQDLTLLKDEIVFVANHFVLHEQYEEILPTYYCVSDPRLFIKGTNREWGELMLKKTKSTIKFFPLRAKRAAQKNKYFVGDEIYYLNYLAHKRIWEQNKMSLNIEKGVYTGDTIIVDFCLPLAFYMGFREIYLLGCDSDYGLESAEDYSEGYFYDPSKTTGMRQAKEYHKNYWYNNIIKSYEVAKRCFERNDCRIYNATEGGKLEVFKRVDFKNLFPACI